MEKCQYEVQNITNLSNAIGYYMDVVKELTGQYRSPLSRYEDFLLNEERYECYEKNQEEVLKDLKDVAEIKEGFCFIKQKLFDDFYQSLLEPLLKENPSLVYFRYIQNSSAQEIQLTLNKYYSINLFLSKDHTQIMSVKIGIAWAYNNEAKGDKLLKEKLENLGDKIKKIESLKSLVFGKGELLHNVDRLPEPSVQNLFLAQKNKITPLHPNAINEIQQHIDIITNALK